MSCDMEFFNKDMQEERCRRIIAQVDATLARSWTSTWTLTGKLLPVSVKDARFIIGENNNNDKDYEPDSSKDSDNSSDGSKSSSDNSTSTDTESASDSVSESDAEQYDEDSEEGADDAPSPKVAPKATVTSKMEPIEFPLNYRSVEVRSSTYGVGDGLFVSKKTKTLSAGTIVSMIPLEPLDAHPTDHQGVFAPGYGRRKGAEAIFAAVEHEHQLFSGRKANDGLVNLRKKRIEHGFNNAMFLYDARFPLAYMVTVVDLRGGDEILVGYGKLNCFWTQERICHCCTMLNIPNTWVAKAWAQCLDSEKVMEELDVNVLNPADYRRAIEQIEELAAAEKAKLDEMKATEDADDSGDGDDTDDEETKRLTAERKDAKAALAKAKAKLRDCKKSLTSQATAMKRAMAKAKAGEKKSQDAACKAALKAIDEEAKAKKREVKQSFRKFNAAPKAEKTTPAPAKLLFSSSSSKKTSSTLILPAAATSSASTAPSASASTAASTPAPKLFFKKDLPLADRCSFHRALESFKKSQKRERSRSRP